MSDIPTDLAGEIGRIWNALAADLQVPAPSLHVQKGALRAHLQGDVFVVPENYVKHFLRFGTIPTALVREAAYEAKKRALHARDKKGHLADADALAYAEAFLRATLLTDPD